jgi:hypothetical protein
MTTIFTHPAVEKYLTELEDALRERPDGHADDLRDQVRGHIEDAIAPDATDAEVLAALTRLGSPESLVAEDVESTPTIVYTRPSVVGWLQQRPRNWWAVIVAVLTMLIAATVVVAVESNIAPLSGQCGPCGFVFVQDRNHVHVDSVAGIEQAKVVQRWGQDQAVTFTIRNPSRYAQRVSGGQIGQPPSQTGEPMRLDIATVSQGRQDLFNEWPRHFVDHAVTIPPHSDQQVVLHWVQNQCFAAGGSETMLGVELHVETLGIKRTETVPFGQAFTIVGSGAAHHCRMGRVAHASFRTSL